jgi:hypothetical protein
MESSAGIFSLFRNGDRLAGTCHGWWMIPLDENRFLQAGKGPENTKEKKSRQCFRFV